MLYISTTNDTLKSLKEEERYPGPLAEYERKFSEANPELCAKFPRYKEELPAYMPTVLVTEPISDPSCRAETVNEIFRFSAQERRTLRKMQDLQWDILDQIVLTDIMEELQGYASNFRKQLDLPLIVSPWSELNKALPRTSIFDFSEETFKFGSKRILNSSKLVSLEKLHQNMMARDVLNRQLYLLRNQNGPKAFVIKRDLEKQIKELTAQIKQQLPAKMSQKLPEFLSKKFSAEEIGKMRSNSYSAKGARKGTLLTTKIDVLNKSGLGRLKDMATELKWLGEGANKSISMLNYGAVAYDAEQAYGTGGAKAAARTFVTGTSAVYLTAEAVTALGGATAIGGYVIGGIAGDAAVGTTLLICSPILGWVVVVVVGVAAASYFGSQTKDLFEQAWDFAETRGTQAYEKIAEAASLAHDELRSAWNSESRWVLDFYGHE
jgi:hypothetical protein